MSRLVDGSEDGHNLRPLKENTRIETVSLDEIDLSDLCFQHRLATRDGPLKRSLERDGQQSPILLWGDTPPYKIIDGHRRTAALRSLGVHSVRAIVRTDLDEGGAFVLSFLENVERKNYTPLDKANAIWRGIHDRGLAKNVLAELFHLTHRQLDRYLSLLKLGEAAKEALVGGEISMAHATLLMSKSEMEQMRWIKRIREEDLSAADLRRRLQRGRQAKRLSPILRVEGEGFRLHPFRYHPGMPKREKDRLEAALRRALDLIRGD